MKIISTAERPINLLQIIGGSIVGGMEIYVLRLLEHLPRDLFHVTCLCISESHFTSQLREMGCSVHLAPMTDETDWQSIQLGVGLIRADAIDVIHAHLPNAHLLAGMLSRLTETPALATIHGRYLSIRDLEVHKLMQTHISVVAKSAYFQALSLGIPASKLRFIANGVDTGIFRPTDKSAYLHSIIKGSPDAQLVGFIGRLAPEKGPDVFIKVASIVLKTLKNCHFVLVGDGPLREKLKDDIDNLGLNKYVHMVGLQSDMPQVYASLDLVVSTSYSEAMPLAIIEGMASGLPVISTNVGGVIDIVEVGRTGFLNNLNDLNGIADNVVTLMSDRSMRQAMGSAARKRAEKNFELSSSVNQTIDLLKSLTQTGFRSERGIEQR
ncbi:glycosyltransferase [Nitrosovibrio tenuis]|uniref:Glycosyltransferase involved in cell wall bisynthesis n=1 Tax=Nitrosovibrio tenuis TaxID=1233 RepID=A0A1H7K5T9_9PROT|nr:glycosyltransferase [Nitrosovibrio tenuis]SEK81934.1 Glycosyltransferase involved in cell wall bisynthesis [Nitrosovibrio tenuis]